MDHKPHPSALPTPVPSKHLSLLGVHLLATANVKMTRGDD